MKKEILFSFIVSEKYIERPVKDKKNDASPGSYEAVCLLVVSKN